MEILVDFQKVVNQANQMEELAEALRQECEGNLTEALNLVAGSWKGEAAERYLRKGTRFQQEMIRSAKDLERSAEVIRKTARIMAEAERAAAALAES